MADLKESYRIDELAKRWDVAARTVRRMIARGALKAFRVGTTQRVRREEILRHEGGNSSDDSQGD